MGLTLEQRDLRDAVRALIAKTGPDRSPWRRLCADIGVAGLAIPELYGGAGAGLPETCVVMAELGRNLTPSPMLGSAVLAAQAVLASGDAAACERLLPAIASGASTPGLFEVDPGHEGGERVGAAERAVQLTVAHLLRRVQFGQPIGAFQALQHRAADLHVLVESARALSRAMALPTTPGDGGGPDLGLRAAAVKVYCSETLTQVASEMVQLHGAIGVTWEHQAHRYLKRAHSGRHLFGVPGRHLSAIAASLIDA